MPTGKGKIPSLFLSPLALPLGELSPQVTERGLQLGLPSPTSLRSATFPMGRGKMSYSSSEARSSN